MVWGCWRVSSMRRRGRPADAEILATVSGLATRMGLSRRVRVLTAALPDGPSIAGWLRPVLLLPPAALLGLSPEQLEAVLAHELAHLRRYDHMVNAAQTLVETLLFYHPAVWWTSARMREERELCCDDMAVRACGDALCFARALTSLERMRVVTPAAALGSTGGSLMYRVQRLIGAGRQECAPSKLSGILALSLGLASLLLNVHWAKGQERAPEENPIAVAFNVRADADAPGVTVDLGGAALLHRSWVEYPESARNNGIQGTVAVEVTLDGGGNVSDAHVVSGPMELRRTVMSSVFDWHFARDSGGGTRLVNVTFGKATTPDPVKKYFFIGNRIPNADSGHGELGVVTLDSPQERVVQGVVTADGANEEQFARLRKLLDEERSRLAGEPESGVSETEEIRKLEAELRSARSVSSSDASEPADREQIRKLEAELRSVKRESEPADREPRSAALRTIESIEVVGLTEGARSDLLSQLPVHVGDTVTGASLEGVGNAVRKFDEHLEWRVVLHEQGRASILIRTPGHEK
jgi:TonB family protein